MGATTTLLTGWACGKACGLGMLHNLVIPLTIIFTIANALAPTIADGGSWYKIFFTMGILSAISGLCLIFLPEVASMLFKTVQV